jgi:hypothetical protein
MPNGYSRSPKLLKGAIIQFSSHLLLPVPNIIVFQYNPDSMTRTIGSSSAAAKKAKGATGDSEDDTKDVNPLSQPVDPRESLTLKLELDAADALEEPETHPVAVITGVADRIAAIEMLLYPTEDGGSSGLLSGTTSSLGGAAGSLLGGSTGTKDVVPRATVPVVLFFWGPRRIVPVRITSFSVNEEAYSPTLYPIRATVTLGLTILDAKAFGEEDSKDSAAVKLARSCYTYTKTQKQALATASIANSFESMGLLPF